ncbi:Uma2 family endonuclease [Allokutzneria albata]|uniref:Endonuclease, Uma2 family (Restriction endonuclease fold) n=1 Tax=Allokutzneria albata TaxID=211114 RepID=A0A1H0BLW5_ALLAB|nr:Uma2 family endonuclease [Allokutzneria albata]SDN46656.1 Endonuclease, Uma2 family (restriction endonuclease fold) [Allokutzneria albata]
MTALSHDMLYPPPDGWTLADVQALPEDCRVEVLDGALIVNPLPLPVRQRIIRRLSAALEPQLAEGWQLEIDIDVMLAEDPLDYLSPDVVVFDAAIPLTTRPIPGNAILLAVEVVSRGSRREDRGSKPLAYAEAGIPHFWRIESPASGALAITAHTFELDEGSGEYRETGAHHPRLATTLVTPVDIDLTALS